MIYQFCRNIQNVAIINIINATCVVKNKNKISVITMLVIIDYFFKKLKEDRVKERGRNSVTLLRIPDNSDSVAVNSQVTKNFLSATKFYILYRQTKLCGWKGYKSLFVRPVPI